MLCGPWWRGGFSDVIMNVMFSQIIRVSIVCSSVCSGANQRKHQSSVSLTFVNGIHRRTVDSPHKGPAMRWMSPFDDVIMSNTRYRQLLQIWHHHNSEISVFHIAIWKVGPSERILSFSHWYMKWRKISSDIVVYVTNAFWWSNKKSTLQWRHMRVMTS